MTVNGRQFVRAYWRVECVASFRCHKSVTCRAALCWVDFSGLERMNLWARRRSLRLIMNFVPLNENCKPLDSDISTLPGISGLSPFLLEGGEGGSGVERRH